jgi:hypothetical protein
MYNYFIYLNYLQAKQKIPQVLSKNSRTYKFSLTPLCKTQILSSLMSVIEDEPKHPNFQGRYYLGDKDPSPNKEVRPGL